MKKVLSIKTDRPELNQDIDMVVGIFDESHVFSFAEIQYFNIDLVDDIEVEKMKTEKLKKDKDNSDLITNTEYKSGAKYVVE